MRNIRGKLYSFSEEREVKLCHISRPSNHIICGNELANNLQLRHGSYPLLGRKVDFSTSYA
jgi:hypothetical protein